MHDYVTAHNETRFSFPAPTLPEHIETGTTYVVAVSSSSFDIHFIGPFTPASPLKLIGDEDVIFRGNFRLSGYFTKENTTHTLVVPKNGRAIICRMEYSLYQYTPALAQAISRIHMRKEKAQQVLRHQYHLEKY